MQMHKITTGFSRSKKWKLSSWIIRKYQGTEFDHTYNIIDGDIFEADGHGVGLDDRDKWLKTHKIILEVTIEVPHYRYIAIKEFVKKHLGKKYSKGQLFRILFNIHSNDNMLKRFICSELTARVMFKELCIDPNEKLDLITPKDIYKRVHKYMYGNASCEVTPLYVEIQE